MQSSEDVQRRRSNQCMGPWTSWEEICERNLPWSEIWVVSECELRKGYVRYVANTHQFEMLEADG